ncbi:hypothetical protein GCM10011351_27420 [Paraliobacillus quinghaiensis]|uniref:XRE family transcriptional regulator n=1 Tax=Paraliobacillus quinghaiensis TaxID=470815 RepID=A0A917TVG0_9BACI|nr:permease prefix domain 1-containing protein [Paraliobacillus quinghaiensis]GGM39794.1 hypothetical protein GCM10011351_27420 [Paraliobacillus quinghaiensis]
MNTIINYLDNMFASLPKTEQIQKLKEEMLVNMEDKYNELKNEGKSENEAIGIVISEFGSLEELINEFNIDLEAKESSLQTLDEKEVNDYIETSKKSGNLIGIGVGLCISGAALLILMTQLVEGGVINGLSESVGDMIGLIPLFILVAIAVGMFIYAGTMMDRFNYMDQGFELSTAQRATIKNANDSFRRTYTRSIIVGVMLCILSPIILITTEAINENASNYGVIVLLGMVAIAVYIFVYFGKINETYKKLLKIDEYAHSSKARKKEDKVIGAVASIVWPLAVCIFLISGLIYHQWHINWIIFPITGLVFAMFSGVYSILKKDEK